MSSTPIPTLQFNGETLFRRNGVYAWLRDNEWLYVGMSNHVFHRLTTHGTVDKVCLVEPQDKILIWECEDVSKARELERQLVGFHQPRFNILLKTSATVLDTLHPSVPRAHMVIPIDVAEANLKPINSMTVLEMQSLILAYVNKHAGTSFHEIMHIIGSSAKGHMAMHPDDNPNLLLWGSMSSELIEAINNLVQQKAIHLVSSSPFIYFMDGGCPGLPVARDVKIYKTLHWLPVGFSAGPGSSSK